MLEEKKLPLADVGAVVARFQAAELHEGHAQLLDTIFKRHDKVLIFLGLTPAKTTFNNPLDFEARKLMILEKYPNADIHYVKNQKEDSVWSKLLDERISDLVSPNQSVMLYGSRDSFIPHYKGRFKTTELMQKVYTSGTEQRKKISNKVKGTVDFRKGVIWAVNNQYPVTMPTIDAAIFNSDKTQLLLARKQHERDYRFVGGFVEPGHNLEQTVRKEVGEETHLEVTDPQYIGSVAIDDWRYRGEKNKVMTAFFEVTSMYGRPTPDDDIEEVRWFAIKWKPNDSDKGGVFDIDLEGQKLIDSHVPLMEMLLKRINKG